MPANPATIVATEPVRPKVFLLITDAGGGHRGSAGSLQAAIAARGLPWDVRIVNVYQEVWHRLEWTRRVFRVSGEDFYNLVLKKNWTRFARGLRWLARHLVRLQARPAGAHLRAFLAREKPDLVVSLMPFVNDVFVAACEKTGIPFGLILTDLVDTRPYMWLTPRACAAAHFVAVGCADAAEAARASGVAAERLVSGNLVIHPKHFAAETRALDPLAARLRFNLVPELFTVVIVMGGYGGAVIRRFVEAFESAPQRWQVVACVGKNEELRVELEQLAPSLENRLVVFGFTRELHLLMRAADVVVTKPGPASIFECLAMGTPMVLDDVHTMPQEVPNAAFVEQGGFGVAVNDRTQMFAAVAALAAEPARLTALRDHVRGHEALDAAPAIIAAMTRALAEADGGYGGDAAQAPSRFVRASSSIARKRAT